jgi:hypothetical protein
MTPADTLKTGTPVPPPAAYAHRPAGARFLLTPGTSASKLIRAFTPTDAQAGYVLDSLLSLRRSFAIGPDGVGYTLVLADAVHPYGYGTLTVWPDADAFSAAVAEAVREIDGCDAGLAEAVVTGSGEVMGLARKAGWDARQTAARVLEALGEEGDTEDSVTLAAHYRP